MGGGRRLRRGEGKRIGGRERRGAADAREIRGAWRGAMGSLLERGLKVMAGREKKEGLGDGKWMEWGRGRWWCSGLAAAAA